MALVPYTTPTHKFTLPIALSNLAAIKIIYEQNGSRILVKTLDDCTLSGKVLSFKLTQQETGKFESNKAVKIQLHGLLKSGDAFQTNTKTVRVEDVLDREVIEA